MEGVRNTMEGERNTMAGVCNTTVGVRNTMEGVHLDDTRTSHNLIVVFAHQNEGEKRPIL